MLNIVLARQGVHASVTTLKILRWLALKNVNLLIMQ